MIVTRPSSADDDPEGPRHSKNTYWMEMSRWKYEDGQTMTEKLLGQEGRREGGKEGRREGGKEGRRECQTLSAWPASTSTVSVNLRR